MNNNDNLIKKNVNIIIILFSKWNDFLIFYNHYNIYVYKKNYNYN